MNRLEEKLLHRGDRRGFEAHRAEGGTHVRLVNGAVARDVRFDEDVSLFGRQEGVVRVFGL